MAARFASLPVIGMFAAVALLAACGKPEDYDRPAVPEREAQAEAAIERAVATNGLATTERTGVPVSRPTETAAQGRAFPTEFLGYWGITANDCELANTAATGRINIDADTIRFYEARARVRELQEISPAELVATLAFSGEGGRRTGVNRFRLEAGGTTLIRTEQPGGTSARYQKC